MFGWLRRRIIKQFLKEVKNNPGMLTEPETSPGLAGPRRSSTDLTGPQRSSTDLSDPQNLAVVPDDDFGDEQDLTLRAYKLQLQRAMMDTKSDPRIVSRAISTWSDKIRDREAEVAEESVQYEKQERRLDRQSTKAAPASLDLNIEIGNLAPHAEQVVDELIKMVRDWGFKEGADVMQKLGRSVMIEQIKEHPDLVKQGLGHFSQFLKSLTQGKSVGEAVAGVTTPGGFDPANPATFPQSWTGGV